MQGPIEAVLSALERADVRYLVVGGVAVVLHGHLRTTADLDLVVQLQPGNVDRAVSALASVGLRPRAPVPFSTFTDPTSRRRLIDEKNVTVFSLWNPEQPGFEVDLFAEEPFDFDSVYARAVRVRLDEVEVSVIGIDDLIENKSRVARPRDLEDVIALRALRSARDDPGGPTHGGR